MKVNHKSHIQTNIQTNLQTNIQGNQNRVMGASPPHEKLRVRFSINLYKIIENCYEYWCDKNCITNKNTFYYKYCVLYLVNGYKNICIYI